MTRTFSGLDPARVAANVADVRSRIAAAAGRANRDPDAIELLAAVKYVPVEELGTLREAGLELFGENRAQELETKAEAHPDARWHFIGQLQSRKVRQLVPRVELIHSVASDSALKELGRHGTPETEVLVEVDVAGEASKAGITPEALGEFIARCPVRVTGLMAMPPATSAPGASRPHFARVRELAEEHGLARLSMGTSQDFEIAVEEGATIVRIGSVLFQGAG